MRAATNWHDYELIDTTSGEKLERWKNITLIRPDPQIIWKTGKNSPGWNRADAHYHRSKTGGGHWEYVHKLPESWKISYGDLTFKISPTGFKHTGLFPEQAVNWDLFMKLIRTRDLVYFGSQPVRLYRRLRRWPACMQVQVSVMSMLPVAWSSGQRKMLSFPDWLTVRCAGLSTTAKSLSSGKSVGDIIMMQLSWTRLPMAAVRMGKSGSWKKRYMTL